MPFVKQKKKLQPVKSITCVLHCWFDKIKHFMTTSCAQGNCDVMEFLQINRIVTTIIESMNCRLSSNQSHIDVYKMSLKSTMSLNLQNLVIIYLNLLFYFVQNQIYLQSTFTHTSNLLSGHLMTLKQYKQYTVNVHIVDKLHTISFVQVICRLY